MFRNNIFSSAGNFFFCLAQTELSTKSKKAIELYTLADNFRVRGQYEEALNLLGQAIEKDKNFVEAYYRRGLTYYFDEAVSQRNQ